MVNAYDAIIIGSGIGGAGIGALLSHADWKVLIIGKNALVGGHCATRNVVELSDSTGIGAALFEPRS